MCDDCEECDAKIKLRPFFCRIGSKRTLVKKILPLFPPHDTYVEPFFGGGAIFWEKCPSKKEVINDLDTELIKGYKLLKTIKSRNFPTTLNTVSKIQAFVNKKPKTDVDKLVYAILTRCNTFGSKEGLKMYSPSNPYAKLKKIDAYQERLKHTTILNQSYETVLKKYDSPKSFFYLDPPYENSDDLYAEYSIDYEKMRELLDTLKGKWLVSINDSPEIRRVFKGHYYKKLTVKPASNSGLGSKSRKELLIANYEF